MKKLVFLAAFMVAVSFAACGGQTETANVVTDSDTVVVDTLVPDTLVPDTVVTDTVAAE